MEIEFISKVFCATNAGSIGSINYSVNTAHITITLNYGLFVALLNIKSAII
jgi:hypothetical protein